MYIASNGVKTAVILRDSDPINPREWDNVGSMICWHSRYNLGDTHNYTDSIEFASKMAHELVPLKNMLEFVNAGKASDLRFKDEGEHLRLQYRWELGKPKGEWYDTELCITKDLTLSDDYDENIAKDTIIENCWPKENLQMCIDADKLVIKPLYLYDHSGIAMSTSSFIGRAHHAEWDSGQVGYIYMTKDEAMHELGMAGEKVYPAMSLTDQPSINLKSRSASYIETLEENGYLQVAPENIFPRSGMDQIELEEYKALASEGNLFKKDHRLYTKEDGSNLDTSISIRPIASFNPDVMPLTEETWRSRADEVLTAEVEEYDNYLQGEVFGFQAYEGTVEVDSCWGFNPGPYSVKDLYDDMFGDWGKELKSKMLDSRYELGDRFDIDDFFANEKFPELRQKIEDLVRTYITTQSQTHALWPYTIPAESILNNENNVFDDIVAKLYDKHTYPNVHDIHDTVQEYAGISRDYEPVISISDMEPNRTYTLDELLTLVSEKGKAKATISLPQQEASRELTI